MKLYDALRHDSELRDDLVGLLDGERERAIVEFELADPTDDHQLRMVKARFDAVRQFRFLLLKEERKTPPNGRR